KVICGRRITSQAEAVFTKIQTTFAGWNAFQRYVACNSLITPPVAIMAWDIHQLFLPETQWLRDLPYHGPCGVPGAPPVEDAANCSNSVQMGDKCYLAGTVNYGTFGIMCKLCYDDVLTNPFW